MSFELWLFNRKEKRKEKQRKKDEAEKKEGFKWAITEYLYSKKSLTHMQSYVLFNDLSNYTTGIREALDTIEKLQGLELKIKELQIKEIKAEIKAKIKKVTYMKSSQLLKYCINGTTGEIEKVWFYDKKDFQKWCRWRYAQGRYFDTFEQAQEALINLFTSEIVIKAETFNKLRKELKKLNNLRDKTRRASESLCKESSCGGLV